MSLPESAEAPRIGIVRLSSLGDIIHGTPAARALRERFGPSAHIAWIVEREFAEVLEGNPYLDDVIAWERGTGLRGFLDFARRLRAARLDLTFDIQGLWKSGWVALLSGAPARVGYRHGREGSHLFANRRVDSRGKGLGVVDRYLDVVAQATGHLACDRGFVLRLTPADRSWAGEFYAAHGLSRDEGTVVICPGSSRPIRCWIEERYARLIDWLAESRGLRTLLLGTEHDAAVIGRIADVAAVPVIQCVGRSAIRQSTALMELATLYVGGDTGPTYLAAAVGTPVVGIFGSTKNNGKLLDPERHIGLESAAPCSRISCQRFDCPTRDCMRDIRLEDVREACRTLLHRIPMMRTRAAVPVRNTT